MLNLRVTDRPFGEKEVKLVCPRCLKTKIYLQGKKASYYTFPPIICSCEFTYPDIVNIMNKGESSTDKKIDYHSAKRYKEQ